MSPARTIFRLFCVLLLCSACRSGLAADIDGLVLARAGKLPILLTVPHGGTDSVPNVATRVRGTTVTDVYTIEIAQALVQQLENALGARPYMVAARFSRKYIDANRAESEAFDSPDAKPAYDAYHNRIRLFIAEIKANFPKGAVLLDIHGQGEDPGVAHRGTRNGATVAALIRTHGAAALTGPDSIFGALQSRGYKVFPPNTPIGDPPEEKRYGGGFTVQTYGSGSPAGIDAIQIEVGRNLRTDSRFVTALGEAIVVFYKAFLAADQVPHAP
jgi:N-formylglutamate amidohydrolase